MSRGEEEEEGLEPLSTDPESATSERSEVLLLRYEQLNHSHYEHSKVIHTTFYLSVVFFAGLLSVVLTTQVRDLFLGGIGLFASFLFLILGNWAWRYLRGREEIKRRQQMVKEEISRHDYALSAGRTIEDTFFFEHSERVEQYKKYFHLSYYALLTIISLFVAITMLLSTGG